MIGSKQVFFGLMDDAGAKAVEFFYDYNASAAIREGPCVLERLQSARLLTRLAEKTGLSRGTLSRTLSERGDPRLHTLAAILAALGLRLSVRPIRKA
jgi:probable addiction module antidote protein